MKTVLDGRLPVDAMSLTEAELWDFKDIATSVRLLGKVDSDADSTSMRAVVPPGSPAEQTRVEIKKTVVEFDEPRVSLADLPSEHAAR